MQRPYLLPPIARRLFDENGTFKPGSHGAYPRAMKEAAKEAGVPVVDLTTVTEQYLAQVGELWSRPLFVWPKDNTHLKYEGAVMMAGFLAEGLRSIGRAIQQPSGRGEGGASKMGPVSRRWSAALQPVIKSMGSTLYGCFVEFYEGTVSQISSLHSSFPARNTSPALPFPFF